MVGTRRMEKMDRKQSVNCSAGFKLIVVRFLPCNRKKKKKT